jgi:mono/diheme cytochrome c family protein
VFKKLGVGVVLAALGCGGPVVGNATNGKTLFNKMALGGLQGCASCHTVTATPNTAGPSLMKIGAGADHKASEHKYASGHAWLIAQMTKPDEEIATGFTAGAMPSFNGALTATELDDVAAYLATLK